MGVPVDSFNMLEAKTHLSRLIADLEDHRVDEIVIARHSRPVARLRRYSDVDPVDTSQRIGAADGVYEVPPDIDTPYGDLSTIFTGSDAGEQKDPQSNPQSNPRSNPRSGAP